MDCLNILEAEVCLSFIAHSQVLAWLSPFSRGSPGVFPSIFQLLRLPAFDSWLLPSTDPTTEHLQSLLASIVISQVALCFLLGSASVIQDPPR